MKIEIDIATKAGLADCHLFTPDGTDRGGDILFFMDGVGIRPALVDMGARFADAGYRVLLPNVYYRAGRARDIAIDPAKIGDENGSERTRMMALYAATTRSLVAEDTASYLDYLARTADGGPRKVGCIGYCMGGGLTLTAAGRFPDRVAAGASIHGGSLATDQPDSPHLLADRMRAEIYVAVAGIDPYLVEGETERLDTALKAAGTRYAMEIYPGVVHGFAVPGMPIYDEAASERHFERVLALFERRIAQG